MKTTTLLALTCVAILSACGTLNDTVADSKGTNKVGEGDYVTGSNLPQRGKRVQTINPEQMQDAIRGQTLQMPGKSGG
ncbi:hypothetical protein [Undibacterium sp. RuRC25W]|uniref:hypothetical protein n=1 Tax=Undibacterium sp. RuRC25W TaxID=3413047 RepID=UPI003BF29EE9